MEELLDFSREVDAALEIDEKKFDYIDDWELNSIEISNVFSFDKKPIKIDFDSIPGLTGIFGKNFNGKSNVVKSIVWGLYKEILGGNQNSSKYLVNIYTDSNSGYVIEHLTINGEKYRITRRITSKGGKNTFNTSYESSARVWDEYMWPLYILLLLAVEFHGTIGLYRLCVKWGWFDGENPKATRKARSEERRVGKEC